MDHRSRGDIWRRSSPLFNAVYIRGCAYGEHLLDRSILIKKLCYRHRDEERVLGFSSRRNFLARVVVFNSRDSYPCDRSAEFFFWFRGFYMQFLLVKRSFVAGISLFKAYRFSFSDWRKFAVIC